MDGLTVPGEPRHHLLSITADAGVDLIIVHIEAVEDMRSLLIEMRAAGKECGIVYNPDTPVEDVLPHLPALDLVLVMSVNPGFGGQSFIESQLDKIRNIRAMIGDRPIDIEVDGAAALEAGITDASEREDSGPMEFTVAMTKASSSDVTINYSIIS